MKGRLLILVIVLGAGTACRPDDQRTGSVDPDALRAELDFTLVGQLDSGNVAYRAGDFEAALRYYRRVTELDPETAAGWFGIYMTERARGNAEAAARALEEARAAAPGASLLRPESEDTIR